MKYQLVLQFAAKIIQDFDVLAAFEELLHHALPPAATVDGHDFGQNEMNLYLLTDTPAIAFERSKEILMQRHPEMDFKAAYREITGEEYIVLWPDGLEEFTVA